ncbi:MAG TPA: hypothetical protein VFM18_10060 [Methanosarcina sp.]|nr:hypothetical protein [Methanosarcina sp.]
MTKTIQLAFFSLVVGILFIASGVQFSYKQANAQPNSQTNPNAAVPVWIASSFPNTASMIQYTGTLSSSAVTQVAASSVGLTNHVYSVQITNASGPAQTVNIMDNSRVIWSIDPASGATVTSTMNLIGTASGVLNVQNVTGTGSVIVNIQGAQF